MWQRSYPQAPHFLGCFISISPYKNLPCLPPISSPCSQDRKKRHKIHGRFENVAFMRVSLSPSKCNISSIPPTSSQISWWSGPISASFQMQHPKANLDKKWVQNPPYYPSLKPSVNKPHPGSLVLTHFSWGWHVSPISTQNIIVCILNAITGTLTLAKDHCIILKKVCNSHWWNWWFFF